MGSTVSTLAIPENAELRHDNGERYCLIGAISFANAGQILSDSQRRFVDHDRVVIDLGLADVGNTAGLAVLMEWAVWCERRGIQLVYEKAPPDILAVAELNGVTPMLPLNSGQSLDVDLFS